LRLAVLERPWAAVAVKQADGVDAYHKAKAAGKYKEYQRTQGVSTTDVVGR
jgi:hypothetical protein